ncbi:phenoloxidase-activating factor 2 [Drosophila kikkawai]|uniref:Phenoloxidase-activating factor 2 n=1 Tax=Drosophila kikkawai TaxID=30033 RepID=A0A6P4IM24_DROKI|nr:phenoloxidase-activating factor 2 [Drosophila kikkawai]
MCQWTETCCHTSQIVSAASSEDHSAVSVGAPLNCGQSYPEGLYEQEQVADNQAQPHEFPWIVALYERRKFLGGGSLLTENCVLTSAHLLVNKTRDSLFVKAGAWDLTETNSRYVERRKVARIVLHSESDLALIVLEVSFLAKRHIGFICQPSPAATFDHQNCLVSGWGKLTHMDRHLSRRLKRVVNRVTCQARLRRTRLGRRFELHTSLICAGGERNRNTCQGFGGSPLMCPIAGHPMQYVLVGIVNSGLGCGSPNVPSLYTSVAEMMPWIHNLLNDEINVPYRPFPIYKIGIKKKLG